MSIRIDRLCKRFGSFVALDDVSFTLREGELVALLGPSGGGKSTILRIISGLERADSGTVHLDGEPADRLHARSRNVGFVFQHYALFRHMSVEENIGFGLEVQKVPLAERRERVAELLRLIGLQGLEGRYPSQLSGGQRQRVALARALAPKPRVLLLDEPFGAVDAKVREELRRWLRRLHDEIPVTSLFVTHDQEEAFAVADRVILIQHGKLEQIGTPAEILDQPASEFVARFVGDVNLIEAKIQGEHAVAGGLKIPIYGFPDGQAVRLVIRIYDLKFWRTEVGAGDAVGTVRRMAPLGDRVKVEADIDGAGALHAQFPRRSSLLRGIEPGCRIGVEVTLARAYAATPAT